MNFTDGQRDSQLRKKLIAWKISHILQEERDGIASNNDSIAKTV
jgi:hypothetical protein